MTLRYSDSSVSFRRQHFPTPRRDSDDHAAYDDHRVVSERTIDSHLKNVRRKLDAAGAPEDSIEGLYGVGYRFGRPSGAG